MSDVRGVALQTVIVIVVLLAIAGAVAGVLLSRGGEAVAEAERQDITRAATEFTNKRPLRGLWLYVGCRGHLYRLVQNPERWISAALRLR